MTEVEATYDRIRRRVLAGLGLIVLELDIRSRRGSDAKDPDGAKDRDGAEDREGAKDRDGADRPGAAAAGGTAEHIAFDLIRFWFDDVWTPGLRYMDGFKGDRDPALEQEFRDAFSEEEYLWLERFNRFLELRVDRLSTEDRKEGRFPGGDTWTAIMRDARNLLELLDPSGQQRLSEKKLLETYREPQS